MPSPKRLFERVAEAWERDQATNAAQDIFSRWLLKQHQTVRNSQEIRDAMARSGAVREGIEFACEVLRKGGEAG